jgi:hypothetical protein
VSHPLITALVNTSFTSVRTENIAIVAAEASKVVEDRDAEEP